MIRTNLKYIFASMPLIQFQDYRTITDYTKCNYDINALYKDKQFISFLIDKNPDTIEQIEKCKISKVEKEYQLQNDKLRNQLKNMLTLDEIMNFINQNVIDGEIENCIKEKILIICKNMTTYKLDTFVKLQKILDIYPILRKNESVQKYIYNLVSNFTDDEFIIYYNEFYYLFDDAINIKLRLSNIIEELEHLLVRDNNKFFTEIKKYKYEMVKAMITKNINLGVITVVDIEKLEKKSAYDKKYFSELYLMCLEKNINMQTIKKYSNKITVEQLDYVLSKHIDKFNIGDIENIFKLNSTKDYLNYYLNLNGYIEKKTIVGKYLDHHVNKLKDGDEIEKYINKYFYYLSPDTILKKSTSFNSLNKLCYLQSISKFVMNCIKPMYLHVGYDTLDNPTRKESAYKFELCNCGSDDCNSSNVVHGYTHIGYKTVKQNNYRYRLEALVIIALQHNNIVLAKKAVDKYPDMFDYSYALINKQCPYNVFAGILQILPNDKISLFNKNNPIRIDTTIDYEKKRALLQTQL